VDGIVTAFTWDWAAGVPEILSDGDALYLVGHETLGQFADGAWTYYLPDALGSVRQATDGAGAVVSSREWSPYGVEAGGAQVGLGYTGECFDGNVGMVYLRARWYEPGVGRFTRRDPWEGKQDEPQTLHAYVYVRNNAVNFTDPSGKWREPTPEEVASVNLDEIWTASRKPRCCYLYEGKCDDICVGRQRVGIPIPPTPLEEFNSADEYMRFWLAWEYVVEENRCVYRKHANCMGAALEASYLYTKSWREDAWKDIFDEGSQYFNLNNGYGDITQWRQLVKDGHFTRVKEMSAGHVVATPGAHHVALVTGHFAGGGLLCFEKQSPGTVFPPFPAPIGKTQQYEKWYYRLIPCDSITVNRIYAPPVEG